MTKYTTIPMLFCLMMGVTLFSTPQRAQAGDVTSGLTLWLDASDAATVQTSGSSVTNWNDKSGNDNGFEQVNTTFSPTLTGGYLVFDGVNDQMTSVSGSLLSTYFGTDSNYTVIVVLRIDEHPWLSPNTSSDSVRMFGDSPGYWGVYARGPIWGPTVFLYHLSYGNPNEEFLSTPVDADQVNGVIAWHDATDKEMYGKTFGAAATSRRVDAPSPRMDVAGALVMGKHNRYYDGEIGEIRIYNRVLNPTERADVEAFLTSKWSTVAPADRDLPPVTDNLTLQHDAGYTGSLHVAGSDVDAWLDKSGSGNFHDDNGTTTRRPLFVANATPTGASALRFDGNSDFLRNSKSSFTNIWSPTEYTVFAVFRADKVKRAGGDIYEFDAILGGAGWGGLGLVSNAVDVYEVRSNHGTGTGLGLSIDLDTWYIVTWYYDGTTMYLSLNTGASTSAAAANWPSWPFANPQNVTVGTRNLNGGPTYFEGDIAEILTYDRELSEAERTSVEDYLGFKWISAYVPPAGTIITIK